jgi:hypothetical protein
VDVGLNNFELVLAPKLLSAILKNGSHLEKLCLIELTEQQCTSLSRMNMLLAKNLKTFVCMSRENENKFSRIAP